MTIDNSVILTKNIKLSTRSPVSKDVFVNRLKEFTENIINYIKDNESAKLGHVKFISTTNGEDYLQLSVLDLDQSPKVSGFLRKTFEKIKITLNIIVFGIDKEAVDKRIDEEIGVLEDYFMSR